jgi:hypothetical protein
VIPSIAEEKHAPNRSQLHPNVQQKKNDQTQESSQLWLFDEALFTGCFNHEVSTLFDAQTPRNLQSSLLTHNTEHLRYKTGFAKAWH